MIYTETPVTDAIRQALVTTWGVDGQEERLFGGEESAAYRIGDHVVRIGPTWRGSAEIEWCHAVARHAVARLPEAVTPVPTPDGATVIRVEDRPVSLWPYIEGAWPDAEVPVQREQAARLLARLHRALADAHPGPRPVPSFAEHGLYGPSDARDPADGLPDPALDRWLAEFHRTHTRRHPLHGDYYAGNTLIHDGVITAVLDWDETFVGVPELELASAALEWGEDDFPASGKEFIACYLEAGGTAEELDEESFAQLLRHRLRREYAYFTKVAAEGVVHDEENLEYHRARVELFHRLRP
ncbi:serine kinase [Spongiactinospora gelatinilytica]|uniref:Serine kinase n=1 Tax=Spongiactinospora gelatinilytica TaxID=2666298 RepID=A0A2W2HM34_9ACTN|nr:phosphotransferase [Spongiactinospora gelatinilytica]PZG40034.1 serine kinase [Spongiactinospora gelatinilytica]